MTVLSSATDPALEAYEALAEHYDAFTDDHDYDRWLSTLLAVAAEHGVVHGIAIDAACGTGKSTAPLVRAGFQVVGTDSSPAMLRQARRRLGPKIALHLADVRDAPPVRDVDLITWLDDAANYLLTIDDLNRGLASLATSLRPGGVLIFDINTLLTYRTVFGTCWTKKRDGVVHRWIGESSGDFSPGELARATVTCQPDTHAAGPSVVSHHLQRHHRPEDVVKAFIRAGLKPVACYGMTPDGALHEEPDESQHHKLIFVASRDVSPKEERR